MGPWAPSSSSSSSYSSSKDRARSPAPPHLLCSASSWFVISSRFKEASRFLFCLHLMAFLNLLKTG